ncbi:hypothetical protein FGG78_26435, partial [Thioclava sp. BHET1]
MNSAKMVQLIGCLGVAVMSAQIASAQTTHGTAADLSSIRPKARPVALQPQPAAAKLATVSTGKMVLPRARPAFLDAAPAAQVTRASTAVDLVMPQPRPAMLIEAS